MLFKRSVLAVSDNRRFRHLVEGTPAVRKVVDRFVAGDDLDRLILALRALHQAGLQATCNYLGEDTHDATQAQAATAAQLQLVERLAAEGLTPGTDMSIKLSALGQMIDESIAFENALAICEAARDAGLTVTIDMEDHTLTTSTVEIHRDLITKIPSVGIVMQAYLHRTEQDCRELAARQARVRLCKGSYREPAAIAFQDAHGVETSYLRCLRELLDGGAYPMFATHDPRLITTIRNILAEQQVDRTRYEFQMLYGVRREEQALMAAGGTPLRVYLPYGREWYRYFTRRLAERPANLLFFLRALALRG